MRPDPDEGCGGGPRAYLPPVTASRLRRRCDVGGDREVADAALLWGFGEAGEREAVPVKRREGEEGGKGEGCERGHGARGIDAEGGFR